MTVKNCSIKYGLPIVLFVFSVSCSTTEPIQEHDVIEVVQERKILPQEEADSAPTWFVPDGPERFLRPLTWDLNHQKIWVRFDFNRRAVLGRTELFLTSVSGVNRELILDSKTTEIHRIYDISARQNLEFVQDSSTISIHFEEAFASGDSLFIGIEFTSFPPNRGLYFVNPDGTDPGKPTQIWTLGQPEDNSFWLPTIDHPAVRTTQETWISVPAEFETLSNGALIEQKVLPGDSLRTDYWFMEKPHAPYLFALAVGKYEIFEEIVDDVVLKYYVEPEFAPYYRSIYADTDDMLRFFNRKLGIKYPWKFYAQVPVHDFIASGMENTTATILFNHVQVTDRQSADVNFQDLIAHELIHQWFGNLVICKDWANLPLNEGFASYFEIIYKKHRNGDMEADWKNLQDRNSYFTEASTYRRPLIFNRYSEPEDMYDRHTYQKAGQILRMLHEKVGEEVWWSALNRYLETFAYQAVDWRDLRDVFLQETGQNMEIFFRQWFTEPGHPEIKVTYNFSYPEATVRIQQVHDMDRQPLFYLPIEIYYKDRYHFDYWKRIEMTSADTTITIDHPVNQLVEVYVDPYRKILAEYTENLNETEYLSRLAHPSVFIRYESLGYLVEKETLGEYEIEVLKQAYYTEPLGDLRRLILEMLTPYADESWKEFIESINSDTEANFRARMVAANMSYAVFGNKSNTYLENLRSDPSYYVERYADRLLNLMN